jgi:hypothetical protein
MRRGFNNRQERPITEQRELTLSTAVLESSQYLFSSDMTIIRPNQALAMNLEVPRILIMVHYPIPRPWMYGFVVGGSFNLEANRQRF